MSMDAQHIQIDIYKRMTPEQRWKEAVRLYWGARKLKAAALKAFHPDWDEPTIQEQVRKIFLHAHT